MKPIHVISLLILILFAMSCDKNRVFEKNTKLPDHNWNIDNVVSFEVNVDDTIHLYNIYINVRHASYYRWSNLWVRLFITFPSGEKIDDRIELLLADKGGKRYGKGLGDIWDLPVLIQERVLLKETGIYKFELKHEMTQFDDLPGIMEIGLRLEKAIPISEITNAEETNNE